MVLALNPVIEGLGQIGAIVICLFAFVFILVALAFNLVMAFGLSWVREKARLIQMLRPQVMSINRTTTEAVQGIPPSDYENRIVRAVASIPARVNGVDQKVEQSTQRVASAVIEFRARTVQAQTIVKTFFLPGLMKKAPRPALTAPKESVTSTPDYRRLLELSAPEKPISIASKDGLLAAETSELDGQLKHASSR